MQSTRVTIIGRRVLLLLAVSLPILGIVISCSKTEDTAHSDAETQLSPCPTNTRPSLVHGLSNPSRAELARVADGFGVPSEQVVAVLTNKETLWRQFETLTSSPHTRSRAVQMLSSIANALQSSQSVKTDSQAEQNGERLPGNRLKPFPSNPSDPDGPDVKVVRAGFMGLSSDKLPEQLFLNEAVQELARLHPDLMVLLAKERAGVVPPTAADYIIFEAVCNGLAESPFLETASSTGPRKTLPGGAGVLDLADARNPIYRYMAARFASVAESDNTKLVKFYSSFLNETDPTIKITAIHALVYTRDPKVAGVLKEFEAKAKERGEAEVLKAIQQEIKRFGSHE